MKSKMFTDISYGVPFLTSPSVMAAELQSASLFERHAAGLGLITYDVNGDVTGPFKEYMNRWTTFEKFVFACYSDELVEKLVKKIAFTPAMSEEQRDDALMSTTAANLRILHSRGVAMVEKQKQATAQADYEGAPPNRLSMEYQIARLKKYKEDHPKEPELDRETRPGVRTWQKLHHMKEVLRFMTPMALDETLTAKQEEKGKKVTKERRDPRSGARRDFDEWVEIARDLSSIYMLKKATHTREALWELDELVETTELQPLHARMYKRLEVEPAAGHRAPTCEEFTIADDKIQSKIAELWNYERLTIKACIARVLADSDLWLDLNQKMAIPDWIALAGVHQAALAAANVAVGGGGGGGGGGTKRPLAIQDVSEPALSRAAKRRKNAAAKALAAAQAKAGGGGKGAKGEGKGSGGASSSGGGGPGGIFPKWWPKTWNKEVCDKRDGNKLKPVCIFFSDKNTGCTRGNACKFVHGCPKLINGNPCSGPHPGFGCPR